MVHLEVSCMGGWGGGGWLGGVVFCFLLKKQNKKKQTTGNKKFYSMSHSLHIPPALDLGPGVIIMLMHLKSKEDSFF